MSSYASAVKPMPVNKEQLLFALQSFTMYLKAAEQTDILEDRKITQMRNQTLDLSDRLKNQKVELDIATKQLNEMITKMNESLPFPPTACGYPEFDTRSFRAQVRAQLIAYQNYLCLQMRAGKISYLDEKPLFDETARLWQKVMRNGISPRMCISNLKKIIELCNAKLEKALQYPLPDEKLYA